MWIIVLGIIVLSVIAFLIYFDYSMEKRIMRECEEDQRILKQEHKKREKSLDSKYGKCTKQLCRDENHFYTVRVYEKSKVLVVDDKAYDFADIIGCMPMPHPIQKDPLPLTITVNKGDMAVKSALGGLAFGPAGFLLGAVSAEKRIEVDKNEEFKRKFGQIMHDNMYRTGGVIMYLQSVTTPQVLIQCYKNDEQELCSVINSIIALTQS